MNTKTTCALIIAMAFLLLITALIVQTAGPLHAKVPVVTAAGATLWIDRTYEVILQGFIILAGVISILLLLGSGKSREGSP